MGKLPSGKKLISEGLHMGVEFEALENWVLRYKKTEEGKIKSTLISLQSHMGSSHMGLCSYSSLK